MTEPIKAAPFEIVEPAPGVRVASNGAVRVTVLEGDAEIKRRRALKGIARRPAGEVALPQLNHLAGELLERLDMPGDEIARRLAAIAGTVHMPPAQQIEWLVVRVGDVRVYLDGSDVVVSRQDLQP